MINHKQPKIKKRYFAEFTDDNGTKQRGVLKSNNGHTCKIQLKTGTIEVARKQVTFIKE